MNHPAPHLPPARPWPTFWLTSAAVFLAALDATAVVAAYPALRAHFSGVSLAALSWTLNAYTIVYAALLVPAGRWADLKGRKRVFMQGLVMFTAASCLCAIAPGIEALVAARALQAAGAALLTPAGLALVLNAFPRDKRAAAVGLFSAVGALAAAVGPAFGSWVIDNASWRWVFLINLPMGLVAGSLSRRGLGESSSPETGARLDVVGVGLLILGAGSLAMGLVQSNAHGWFSASSGVPLVTGLLLIVGSSIWARGRPSAAIDTSMFRDRSFSFVNSATLVLGVVFTMMFLSSFLFLMGVWGYSQTLAGLAVTPGQLLGGAAVGLILPALSGAAVSGLGPTRLGVGGGINNALRQMGGAIGAALAVTLVGSVGAGLAQFTALYAILAGLGLLTAVLCLPVDTRPMSAKAVVA